MTTQRAGILQTGITAGIVLAVLLEVYAHTTLLYTYDPAKTSIIYVLAGLCVAFLPLFAKGNIALPNSKLTIYLTWLGLAVFFVFLTQKLSSLFAAHPLDYKVADMLPIMEVLSDRFLHGQHVYDKIPEIWNGMQPIYLPAMWLPFLVSTLLDIDPRWITLSFVIIGVSICCQVWVIKPRPLLSLIILLPLYWFFIAFTQRDRGYFIDTQEGLVIGYYLFLAFALIKDKPYLIGFAAALCLMSRFSFIFWLLAFGCYLLFTKKYRYLLKAVVVCAFTTLVIMVVTGAIQHLDVFMGLQRTYLHAVRPNNEWKYGGMIMEGLGFARFWAYENLKQLHGVFLILNSLVPIGVFSFFLIKGNKPGRILLALCTLKLSLVLFYNLLIIPAGYLFYTSTFFSLAILYYWLTGEKHEHKTLPAS